MGTLKNGPFGHLHGKVGNLVSYTLNGKNVTRMAGKTNKPPSKEQLAEYQRMGVTNQFLKPLLTYLNLGFALEAEGTSSNAYNKAVSYNKVNALHGEYPNISVDYSKAMISKGTLPPALSPTARTTVDGLELTWQIPLELDFRYLNNRTMIAVYFPGEMSGTSNPEPVMELSGSRRRECRDFIAMSPDELSRPFVVYLAFIADDRWTVSDSVWVDMVTNQRLHQDSEQNLTIL